PSGVAENCGALGVLKVDLAKLPEGVDPAAIRQCKQHPLGHAGPRNGTSAAVEDGALSKRACWYGDSYGCTDGYCYKSCNTKGSGQWCWQAWDKGWGQWRTCAGKGDCKPNKSSDCGQGGCDACGCSC
ncbi:hypothetical protein AURDEDRAFT_62495, partial [Auricularia subglabra TFB-10046 SS5]